MIRKYYVILPNITAWDLIDFIKKFNAKKVPEGFSYNSGTNKNWESVESLRKLILEHVDSSFKL